jgi:hypothetical protein
MSSASRTVVGNGKSPLAGHYLVLPRESCSTWILVACEGCQYRAQAENLAVGNTRVVQDGCWKYNWHVSAADSKRWLVAFAVDESMPLRSSDDELDATKS